MIDCGREWIVLNFRVRGQRSWSQDDVKEKACKDNRT